MAPEIDQTVFSWSHFLLKLSRQCLKQFVRSLHVGFPPAKCRIDERLLCCHSFACLPCVRIACPQSSYFLPRTCSSSMFPSSDSSKRNSVTSTNVPAVTGKINPAGRDRSLIAQGHRDARKPSRVAGSHE